MICQFRSALSVFLLGTSLCFLSAPVQADAPCELMWDYFDDFPGDYWTVLSGDWAVEAGHTSAGSDQWADGYWAVSHSGVGEWNGNYRVYADVSFGDELAGEITIFLKLGPDYKGYALSLDGDNDRVELWEAQINEDGTIDHLRTFVELEDFGLTEGHVYQVKIDHYNKRDLICTIDLEQVISIYNRAHPDGGVAVGYLGPGRAHFHEMCVDLVIPLPWLCFIQAAKNIDSTLPPFTGLGRILLLVPLIFIGIAGILHEYRARNPLARILHETSSRERRKC